MVALRNIRGLEVDAGIRMLLGREQLYLSVLRRFVLTEHAFAEQLASALAVRDHAEAVRLAHTLKGISAQIGANRLHKSARALEKALLDSASPSTLIALIADTTSQLAHLLTQIEEALPPEKHEVHPHTVDEGKTQALCVQLAKLLAQDDFTAQKLLQDNEAYLLDKFGDGLSGIRDAVAEFNYPLALERLRALADDCGLQPSDEPH